MIRWEGCLGDKRKVNHGAMWFKFRNDKWWVVELMKMWGFTWRWKMKIKILGRAKLKFNSKILLLEWKITRSEIKIVHPMKKILNNNCKSLHLHEHTLKLCPKSNLSYFLFSIYFSTIKKYIQKKDFKFFNKKKRLIDTFDL